MGPSSYLQIIKSFFLIRLDIFDLYDASFSSPSIREELNFIHNRYFPFLFLIYFKKPIPMPAMTKKIALSLLATTIKRIENWKEYIMF